MSKKNKKSMNPVLKKTLVTVIAIFLLMSILGGSCAGIAGKLGIKDLFPNIGFIPLFPEDRESIDLSADETSSELESDTESIKESESEPEKESHEPPDVNESVSSSGGNVVDSESEGNLPDDSEGENPGESESELPGGNENPGESGSETPGGNENPGESESERPGGSETPGESERPGESENPGESESESESERPGESESESESGSESESESESESFPTDVVTYPFSGLEIVNSGGTFTKDVVTINATSSSDMRLRTQEITITVENDYSIVKVVLNCESNNTYEFTVEITPDGGIINFEGGIVEIVIHGGTAYLQITFNRTVTVDSIDVSIST